MLPAAAPFIQAEPTAGLGGKSVRFLVFRKKKRCLMSAGCVKTGRELTWAMCEGTFLPRPNKTNHCRFEDLVSDEASGLQLVKHKFN